MSNYSTKVSKKIRAFVTLMIVSLMLCVSVMASELRADLNHDGIVNMLDMGILASEWLATGTPASIFLQFDGVEGVVTVPDATGVRPGTSAFTISFWVKFKNLPQGIPGGFPGPFYTSKGVISRYLGGKGFDILVFGLSGDSYLYFRETDGLTGAEIGTGNNTIVVNTWYHCMCTRSGNTVKIYLDGVLKGTYSHGTTANLNNTDDLIFGATNEGNNADCSLDAIRIYKSALTVDDALTIYAAGKDAVYTQTGTGLGNASAVFQFNEGKGIKVTDAVGGTLQGILSGGVTWVGGCCPDCQ